MPSAHYDPYLIQTELETIQSEAVLRPVIEQLDLSRLWGTQFGAGQPLQTSQTLQLLKASLQVRPVLNTSIIEIRAFGKSPDEAASLANIIVGCYLGHVTSSSHTVAVEILENARLDFKPVRPNRPMNLLIAAVAGLVLGSLAGAFWGKQQA
jgi:capsular polysaccharide biosynthesis protein